MPFSAWLLATVEFHAEEWRAKEFLFLREG